MERYLLKGGRIPALAGPGRYLYLGKTIGSALFAEEALAYG